MSTGLAAPNGFERDEPLAGESVLGRGASLRGLSSSLRRSVGAFPSAEGFRQDEKSRSSFRRPRPPSWSPNPKRDLLTTGLPVRQLEDMSLALGSAGTIGPRRRGESVLGVNRPPKPWRPPSEEIDMLSKPEMPLSLELGGRGAARRHCVASSAAVCREPRDGDSATLTRTLRPCIGLPVNVNASFNSSSVANSTYP